MDPFIAGIAIHEASRNRKQQDEEEKQYMDPYTPYEYVRIRHQERLDEAAKARRREIAPPLSSRLFGIVRRIVQAVVSVRVTLSIRTQSAADHSHRALAEPDVCIE